MEHARIDLKLWSDITRCYCDTIKTLDLVHMDDSCTE